MTIPQEVAIWPASVPAEVLDRLYAEHKEKMDSARASTMHLMDRIAKLEAELHERRLDLADVKYGIRVALEEIAQGETDDGMMKLKNLST